MEVFDTTTKTYNIDKKIDYFTIKAMVIQSLENIVREELNRRIAGINLHKIALDIQQEDKEDVVIVHTNNNLFDSQDDNNNNKLSAPLLKLKIRNTTEYLNWRIAILRRDNFKCRMCTASIKDNKSLRLEVHHSKSFNDLCNENNITTVKQALTCKEIWSLDNGICLCYSCHKNLEKLRAKIRNIFV
ncbi:MAG: hypothetical protein JO327_08100 [Nitrososphaeraceae archaeon]|nr:hypothetical protein [Nitrososphaeraceae archaeon]